MSNDNDKIVERIRKLLNLADDDAAAIGEADNALRFARRLMLQHNVTDGDLNTAKDATEHAADAENVEYGRTTAWTSSGRMTHWEGTLAWAIIKLVGTIKWYRESPENKVVDGRVVLNDKAQATKAVPIVFYGPAEDCQDAAELMEEWSLTIAAMARMRYGSAFVNAGRCYAEGFCDKLHARMNKIAAEEKQLGQGTHALVVQNATALMAAKQARAELWLQEEHGIKIRSGGAGRRGGYDHGAYNAGRNDGSTTEFSRQRRRKLN